MDAVAKVCLFFLQGIAGVIFGISPAPFCSSRELYFPVLRSKKTSAVRRGARGGDDDEDTEYFFDGYNMDMGVYTDLKQIDENKIESTILSQDKVYVDKHILFHRLYVGLSSHVGLSAEIQEMLASYLPITHAVLVRPLKEGRGQDLVDVWYRAMQDSSKAAEGADLLKVPSFHWARVYRI